MTLKSALTKIVPYASFPYADHALRQVGVENSESFLEFQICESLNDFKLQNWKIKMIFNCKSTKLQMFFKTAKLLIFSKCKINFENPNLPAEAIDAHVDLLIAAANALR